MQHLFKPPQRCWAHRTELDSQMPHMVQNNPCSLSIALMRTCFKPLQISWPHTQHGITHWDGTCAAFMGDGVGHLQTCIQIAHQTYIGLKSDVAV